MDWASLGIGPQGSEAELEQLQASLAADPSNLLARHNFAVELRMLGRFEEALAAAEMAWEAGLTIPETATTRGHDLVDLGRYDEAVEAYRQAMAVDPTHVAAHEALAALLPQIGKGECALDSYAQALARAPNSVPLWTSALTTANAQHRFDRLGQLARQAIDRFGEDPVLVGYAACALAGQGRLSDARQQLAAALTRQPAYATGHLIHARLLLGLGDAAGAAAAAHSAWNLEPHNQLALTLLGTAWRLLDDPREAWLCRYDELVMPLAIDLPEGAAEALQARHRFSANPAEQSLRGGTQTPGNLFHSTDPHVAELARRILVAIEDWLTSLPREQDHPFLGRCTGSIRFSASWSVRLADQGFHVSHIHPAGWLSSALYLALPESVKAGSGEGVLTFGVQDTALGLDLPPRRVVQPRVGELVLFPSYLWHGTTPFRSDESRLTAAFDALPVSR